MCRGQGYIACRMSVALCSIRPSDGIRSTESYAIGRNPSHVIFSERKPATHIRQKKVSPARIGTESMTNDGIEGGISCL